MWQEMAEKIKIMGGKIILNAKVVKINKSQDKITSVEYIENNQRKKIEAEIIYLK